MYDPVYDVGTIDNCTAGAWCIFGCNSNHYLGTYLLCEDGTVSCMQTCVTVKKDIRSTGFDDKIRFQNSGCMHDLTSGCMQNHLVKIKDPQDHTTVRTI